MKFCLTSSDLTSLKVNYKRHYIFGKVDSFKLGIIFFT